jgi:hypothetical protein
MFSNGSVFWERNPQFREPLEVLADFGILKRAEFHEPVKEFSYKPELVKEPNIYESRYRYKLINGYNVNYNCDYLIIADKDIDKLIKALKDANIYYRRDENYISIEESEGYENDYYMHIQTPKSL